jgi:sulfide:quinone oxidoreductase
VKKLLVLGAGTAGTMVVNKLRPRLDADDWQITVVDANEAHHYQPGYLFIPFGIYSRNDIVKSRRDFVPSGVEFVLGDIDVVEPEANRVKLMDGTILDYDYLVIASGTTPRPDQTPGLDSDAYGDTIHDFYTLEGAEALARKLQTWDGGRMAINVIEMPIKCPVAPLEFTFLADWYFHERGMRDAVELVYVTPLPGAFTKPVASKHLGSLLTEKKVMVEEDYFLMEVDSEEQKLVSFDEREVPYDLLVTVPVNMGADYIARSGMGDELNYVPVDKETFLSKKYDNVFAIGDASNIPTSKAGSVAHFAVEVFTENFLRHIVGLEMTASFDGHANCFIESGFGKGMLIDFNYDTEPLPGKYPLPGIGPFSLLKETEMNHWGKMMFKWVYWNLMMKGLELPLEAQFNIAGKLRQTA